MKWMFCIAMLFLFGTTMLFSQQFKLASIDSKGIITLDQGPLSATYEVNFSTLPFADAKSAEAYFQKMNVEDIIVTVDKEKKTATIKLDLKKKPNWSKAIWTAYLQRYTGAITR